MQNKKGPKDCVYCQKTNPQSNNTRCYSDHGNHNKTVPKHFIHAS